MINHASLFSIVLVLLLQIFSTSCGDLHKSTKFEDTPDWEILIFTQRWPLTACSQWKEKSKNNTCAFPNPQDLWTIHGIWPTKPGTKGPQNCNNTWHFNETVIDPIKLKLEEYWTNVEKNTKLNSLWKHEWTKHGTCAAILPQLNNELNYFNQGLEWIQKYNMKDVLAKQQVTPNMQGYTVQKIFDSVVLVLKKNPIIECVVDRVTKLSFITEIRICFNKSLELVDCDTVKDEKYKKIGNVLTNCNVNKPVMYPSKVTPGPTTVASLEMNEPETSDCLSNLVDLYNTRERLINFHKTLKFLIWATL